jgi:hypothetical protein
MISKHMCPCHNIAGSAVRVTAATIVTGIFLVGPPPVKAQSTSNVVVQWNNAALQGVRDAKLGPPDGGEGAGDRTHMRVRRVGGL